MISEKNGERAGGTGSARVKDRGNTSTGETTGERIENEREEATVSGGEKSNQRGFEKHSPLIPPRSRTVISHPGVSNASISLHPLKQKGVAGFVTISSREGGTCLARRFAVRARLSPATLLPTLYASKRI